MLSYKVCFGKRTSLSVCFHKIPGPPAQRAGYSLIEILITLVVVSAGFLGVLAAQSHSAQNAFVISHQVIALQAIDDITQRLLSNRNAARDGLYQFSGGSMGDESGTCSGMTQLTCDSSTIARADLSEWAYRIGQLPQGYGLITNIGENQISVTVLWASSDNDRTPESAGGQCQDGRYGARDCVSQIVQL